MPRSLITSRHPSHSAIDLCNDDSTAGPDFVSHHDGTYCDMANKRSYPLCASTEEEDCFNLDAATLYRGALLKRDPGLREGREVVRKL